MFFGDFIPALSRACAQGTRVWAFEPNPENFRCAQVTIALNGLKNVELTHAGLGERAGEASMAVSDPGGRGLGGSSYISTGPDEQNQTVPVRIVAIDEVVPSERRVSII